MMSRKANEALEINTQHLPLRQNAEAKGRGKGIEAVGYRERMKRGSGIKDRDERSRGAEILMTDAFTKIKPTEPFRLAKQAARMNRKFRFLRAACLALKKNFIVSLFFLSFSLSLKRVYLERKLIILNEKNKSALNG
jgi:hypothetical protein